MFSGVCVERLWFRNLRCGFVNVIADRFEADEEPETYPDSQSELELSFESFSEDMVR